MKTAAIFAFSALSSLVAAVPVKRDIVWVTHTKEFIETVEVTTTLWVNPAEYSAIAQSTGGQFYETPTVEATPTPSDFSSYVAPVASSPASVYTPPPAPTTTETPVSVYTPPAPATTELPTTTETPTPVYTPATSTTPAYTPSPTVQSSSGSGSGGSGQTYTGQLTFYTPGLGACGWTSSDSDAIVALAAGMMGEQSNGNPWCGKSITIEYGGISKTATIADKCPGCEGASLDLSPGLFSEFASQSVGVLKDAKWYVNE